jgi:hypothetical protein
MMRAGKREKTDSIYHVLNNERLFMAVEWKSEVIKSRSVAGTGRNGRAWLSIVAWNLAHQSSISGLCPIAHNNNPLNFPTDLLLNYYLSSRLFPPSP